MTNKHNRAGLPAMGLVDAETPWPVGRRDAGADG
jgi:hypothetical protein